MLKRRWQAILIITLLLFTAAIIALRTPDPAGWIQVAIGAISLPILLYELNQIRQGLDQSPDISIGLASVQHLPLSKLRTRHTLPTTITVAWGYPHVILALRNNGSVTAKFLKIHLEYLSRNTSSSLTHPTLKISEFDEAKPGFIAENNFDFTFTGGADWILYPGDTEIFSFHMDINIKYSTRTGARREYPDNGTYHLRCTVWAEALAQPMTQELTVIIADEAIE